jgi:hypothetical protein
MITINIVEQEEKKIMTHHVKKPVECRLKFPSNKNNKR